MTPTLCPHNVTTTDLLFHLLSTTPSDDSDRTGDFLYCNETKQVWNDERFFTLQFELAFALKFVCYPKCSCVVQVIIQIIPAPRQYGHQHRAGSGVPLIVRALWRWIRDGSDDGPAARCRQRLAGPARAPLHLYGVPLQGVQKAPRHCKVNDENDIMLSWYKPVHYARRPGRASQFLHQCTQYLKKASSQYSQYAKKVSSQESLCFIHTSIPDCWLRQRNLRFHLPAPTASLRG